MRVLALTALAVAMVGCTHAPTKPEPPARQGPDVDVEVLAMHSRPLRVVYTPPAEVKPKEEEEKPRPRRKKRRKATPPVQKKVELPPNESFSPKPRPVVDEAPIDIPAEGDWAAALSKEFKRREAEKKRQEGGEGE